MVLTYINEVKERLRDRAKQKTASDQPSELADFGPCASHNLFAHVMIKNLPTCTATAVGNFFTSIIQYLFRFLTLLSIQKPAQK